MSKVPNATESLLNRTKTLLALRGDLTLRQIAEGAGVGHQWLRGLAYGAIKDPGVSRLEKLHAFLSDYVAAQRFERSRQKKLTREARAL
jgi:hypothetical protein